MADLAAPFGLTFEPPSAATRSALGEILGPIVTIANPLDYHTFIWGDGPRTTAVFTAMLQDYDAGIYLLDPPRQDRCDPAGYQPALDAIVAAARATGKPAFPVASLPENFDEERAMELMGQGVCTLMGLETALAAIRAAQTPAGAAGLASGTGACTARNHHALGSRRQGLAGRGGRAGAAGGHGSDPGRTAGARPSA